MVLPHPGEVRVGQAGWQEGRAVLWRPWLRAGHGAEGSILRPEEQRWRQLLRAAQGSGKGGSRPLDLSAPKLGWGPPWKGKISPLFSSTSSSQRHNPGPRHGATQCGAAKRQTVPSPQPPTIPVPLHSVPTQDCTRYFQKTLKSPGILERSYHSLSQDALLEGSVAPQEPENSCWTRAGWHRGHGPRVVPTGQRGICSWDLGLHSGVPNPIRMRPEFSEGAPAGVNTQQPLGAAPQVLLCTS